VTGNSIGKIFQVTTFGESHGDVIGCVIDGIPSGVAINYDLIIEFLAERSAKNKFNTSRIEKDEPEILSGIFEGKTTGTPIIVLIKNKNVKSHDYENIKNCYRPSHADFTYLKKYGIYDYRGGGRASARNTAPLVVAGAIAYQLLKEYGIQIFAGVVQIGKIKIKERNFEMVKNNDLFVTTGDDSVIDMAYRDLDSIKKNGDSVGSIVEVIVKNLPIGLGEPIFDKIEADIAKLIMSMPAVKGIEFGLGFDFVNYVGSEVNDEIMYEDNKIKFTTNNSGGILGGITNGEDLWFRYVLKPVSSISINQKTVDFNNNLVDLKIEGRHDSFVGGRSCVIAKSLVAISLFDHILRNKIYE
jgi:chorismate synthase